MNYNSLILLMSF